LLAIGGGIGGGGIGGSGIGGYSGGEGEPQIDADRSRDLMQAAVDILSMQVDDLANALKPRLAQYLTAFTDGQFQPASFGPRGELTLAQSGQSNPIAYVALSPEQVDGVDAALRFALVEAIVSRFKIPLVIDDPFLAFPTKKRMILSQVLTYLGNATQIVLLTEKQDVTGNILVIA
jgi:uncharacterized protein YhaN